MGLRSSWVWADARPSSMSLSGPDLGFFRMSVILDSFLTLALEICRKLARDRPGASLPLGSVSSSVMGGGTSNTMSVASITSSLWLSVIEGGGREGGPGGGASGGARDLVIDGTCGGTWRTMLPGSLFFRASSFCSAAFCPSSLTLLDQWAPGKGRSLCVRLICLWHSITLCSLVYSCSSSL
jgi:hypothetical protein